MICKQDPAFLRLFLLRHAKSAWDTNAASDFVRPLSARGIRACKVMGTYCREQEIRPDRVLISAATRTLETWQRLQPYAPTLPALNDPDIHVTRDLYHASAAQMLALMASSGPAPGPRSMMLVGHNPGLHTLALTLGKQGNTETRGTMADKFPTAALAIIDIRATSWAEAGTSPGTLIRFVTPKMLLSSD